MTVKFILHPGWEPAGSDWRWVSAGDLQRRHGLKERECLAMDYRTPESWHHRCFLALQRLKHIYPNFTYKRILNPPPPPPHVKTRAELLEEARKVAGLSRKQMAIRLNVGINCYTQAERGRTPLSESLELRAYEVLEDHINQCLRSLSEQRQQKGAVS